MLAGVGTDRYERFAIQRPPFIADEQWAAIEVELARLERSLGSDDDGQVISDLKCLVESVAKVVLETNGTPAEPKAALKDLVAKAHRALVGYGGDELAHGSPYGALATQASKMAQSLGEIRNAVGGGHGRARRPVIRDEMVDLALDGALIWTRWALRRLGPFTEGRPEPLIRDLIEEPAIFRSGDLARRLQSAKLATLPPHHQQSLGVAVGQRSARHTFVVRADGVEPALASPDIELWPPAYRLGLARGILFDPSEAPTVSAKALLDALLLMAPVTTYDSEFGELLAQAVVSTSEIAGESVQFPEVISILGQRARRATPGAREEYEFALRQLKIHQNLALARGLVGLFTKKHEQ